MSEIPAKSGASYGESQLQEKIRACRQTPSRKFIMNSAHSLYKRMSANTRLKSFNESTESAADFLENPQVINKIHSLDKNLRDGAVLSRPWSGDFWALRSGTAAKRYMDPNFPAHGSWQDAYNYYLANPPLKTEQALLAPTEKYDLIVGDKNFSLTSANWSQGQSYNDEFGEVEAWMGICHGWAPASFMEPRPVRTVSIPSYVSGQTPVTFVPDDVKALATLKWANGTVITSDYSRPGTRFLGSRCHDKAPPTDPETDRIINPGCFDLNPGTWHIVVTNQVGSERRPFIIDAAYDYEVWNQPVSTYSYRYFNPKTMKESDVLEKSTISFKDPDFKDKFSNYRKNPNAVKLVGIVMTLSYVIETQPRGLQVDSPDNDNERTVTYYYDLEIDGNDQIIGGEWYQNSHPDFIWMPVKESMALNQEDMQVRNDNDVIRVAPYASQAAASPLNYVLQKIIAASAVN
ncbi:MAG: hypothetical protein AABZ31_07260 [Bdellovibrionota bacterium]